MTQKILTQILDFLWSKHCLNCGKEGQYLCDDCISLIDISREPPCSGFRYLDKLYFPTTYDEKLVRAVISRYKYSYAKELSKTLANLIISHFKLMDKSPPFLSEDTDNFLICAVPLYKSKLKQRGFNQSEEIAKHLSNFLNIPFSPNLLIKTKKTLPQMSLNKNQRLKNISNCFEINPEKKSQIIDKKILLIDDVFTTGATIGECAKILKQNQTQFVWGIVVARD
ncbi:MAG: ComF family protein [Patescibacteria group bacterium]|nr:ComF family protein [Patescibacteria group bacterium]